MRVVHVSQSIRGGGSSWFRLHESFLESGIDSVIINSEVLSISNHIYKEPPTTVYRRLLWKYMRWKHSNVNNYVKNNQLYGTWSPYRTYNSLHKHDIVRSADVINLHAVGGYVDYKSWFTNINKPIVWTIHDENPLGGLFHLYYGNKIDDDDISALDSKVLQKKRSYVNSYERRVQMIRYICPSEYMRDRLIATGIRPDKVFNIPNLLPKYAFDCYSPDSAARENYGITKRDFVLLYISTYPQSHVKGYDVIKYLKDLNLPRVKIVIVGARADKELIHGENIVHIPYLSNSKDVLKLFDLADCTIVPSKTENCPSVILESLVRGVPVIASNVGGIPEMLSKANGMLVDPWDYDGFVEAVLSLQRGNVMFDHDKMISEVFKKYHQDVIVPKYLAVYRDALDDGRLS